MPKILIAEDEHSIANLIRDSLNKDGFNTETAYDGEEALAKAELFKPDLLVLDIMMPKMNGYGVLRELSARIRVILRRSSGQTESAVIRRGDLTIDSDRMEITRDGIQLTLTPTEFRLLVTLAKTPGRVFTRMQLLEVLGEAYIGYDRTLDTHISNLRKKIETDPSNPRMILTVYGIGYKLGGGA